MSRSVGITTHYRSEYSQRSNVRGEAYPWQDEQQQQDETAPSGPARTTTRTPEELAEELNKLKEAGVPLNSMKLVPNSDLDALQGDASRVLSLNERLARYVMYVSQLEKSNRELGE